MMAPEHHGRVRDQSEKMTQKENTKDDARDA
jgi:hypothetical protein